MKIKPEKKEPEQKPMASTKRDIRQLRENSGATVAELKVFLKQLKGKSPQEMLGMLSASQLFRAIGLASVIVLVTGLVFTAIPYALGGGKDEDKEPAKPKSPATEAAKPGPETASTPKVPAPAEIGNTKPDISPLGVSEEKTAPPNVNPLENKKDDFLKGLE